MNKIGKYWKNKRGITLVWGAFFLILCLMLAGMAIDLSYMYHVKNQLQVAADAAALAGAAKLDGSISTAQDSVRQEAWKYACKNRAGGVTAGTNVNSSSNNVYLANHSGTCDSPPSGTLLNGGNSPVGDIILGNWDPITRPQTPTTDCRFLPASAPGCPSLPPTALMNAVKVVARRTGAGAVDNISSGNNSVNVFLGQIFRMIETDWSFMSAVSSAIAARPLRASSFVAMGSSACDYDAHSNPDCTGPGSPYPYCTGPNAASFRVLTTSEPGCCASSCIAGSDPLGSSCSCCWRTFSWTGLALNLSTSTFDDKACTTPPYEDICGTPCTPGGQVFGLTGGSTGGAFADYQAVLYDPMFDSGNKSCATADLKCHNSSDTVTGWTTTFPWTAQVNPISGNPDCSGGGGGAYRVLGYVNVHIIAICVPPGVTGNGCGGPPPFPSHGYPTSIPPLCTSLGLPPGASAIVIDNIHCVSCGEAEFGSKAVLVK